MQGEGRLGWRRPPGCNEVALIKNQRTAETLAGIELAQRHFFDPGGGRAILQPVDRTPAHKAFDQIARAAKV